MLTTVGAGRVAFSSRVSFMSAVSCRFFQITYMDIDKKVGSEHKSSIMHTGVSSSGSCLSFCSLLIFSSFCSLPILSKGGSQTICTWWSGVRWVQWNTLQRTERSLLLWQHPLPALLLWTLLGKCSLCSRHSESPLLHQREWRPPTCYQLLLTVPPQSNSSSHIKG